MLPPFFFWSLGVQGNGYCYYATIRDRAWEETLLEKGTPKGSSSEIHRSGSTKLG